MPSAANLESLEVLNHVATPLVCVSAAPTHAVLYVNRAFTQAYGFEKAELNALGEWAALPDSPFGLEFPLQPAANSEADQVVQGQLPALRIRCRDGSRRDVLVECSPFKDMLLLTFSDNCAEQQSEDSQPTTEMHFRRFVENLNDIIFVTDLQGSLTYLSPSYTQTFGIESDTLLGQSFIKVLHPEDRDACLAAFASVLLGNRVNGVEYRVAQSDGSWSWQAANLGPIRDERGHITSVVGVSRDISLHKEYEGELRMAKEAADLLNLALEDANKKLARLATTDSLTGLWNRRHFEDRANHEIAIACRYSKPASLLLLDIDHFKQINDRFGHLVGDHVLKVLAQSLGTQIRAADMPCRWGGEEFMVLMPNCGPEDAQRAAEKLRVSFASKEIPVAGRITASFGVATYQAGETMDSWIDRVDDALYAAKTAGRNAVKLAPTNRIWI